MTASALELDVALLAAEVDLLEELIARGILPPNARRTPTERELRAGVRFAELDRIVNQAAMLLMRKTEDVRAEVLDGLATQLGPVLAEADPWAALEQLDRLTDPTRDDSIPGLRQVLDRVTRDIAGDLTATAHAAADEAIEEGRRQGIPDHLIEAPVLDDAVDQAAQAHARRVATMPATKLLDAAAEAGARAATAAGATGASVAAAALDGAEAASIKAVEDTARQAANVTHGLGRTAGQAALPAPAEVYASELLDSSTCGPCATVDGRTYVDLEAALVDYPGAGGYIGCDGGSRCRGTLVLVHGSEAPPTLDNPGDGRGGPPPVDRTPQGPSGVGRPDHLDPDGNIIPKRPTKGLPSTPPALELDDQAVSIQPTTAEPIATVAPGQVDRDPELATYRDDELDRLLGDDAEPLARRMAAADELDQRAAGTRSQVWEEEQLDAATLASYEADREAWEKAGGYAAAPTSTTKPAGRKIDRVRSEWVDELHQHQLAAEEQTRGSLLHRDRRAEYVSKYGTDATALFEGPARSAYYYASPELRAYWDNLPNGRPTFAEFAVERGITDAKTLARAKAAAAARNDAWLRADESAAGKAKRAAQRAAKRGQPLSEGQRLEAAQKRRDRLRKAERDQAQVTGRVDVPEAPSAPPAPARGALTREQYDALTPSSSWSEEHRTRILEALKTSDSGKVLGDTLEKFQDGGSIARLRGVIDKRLAGETVPATSAARADALLDAIRHAPDDWTPDTLYRGMTVKGTLDNVLAKYTGTDSLDLSLTSFTSDRNVAKRFQNMTSKGGREVRVMVELIGPGKKALPIQNLPKDRRLFKEKEWVSAGRYRVVEAKKAPGGGIILRVEQTGTL